MIAKMAGPDSITMAEKAGEPPPNPKSPVKAPLSLDDNMKPETENTISDIAEGLFKEIEEYSAEELEAEKARVLRLIDWRIMPIVSMPESSSRRLLTF